MAGWMWGGELDGWICVRSSIRGTNVSTNRNQAHAIVFSLLFFFQIFLLSWTAEGGQVLTASTPVKGLASSGLAAIGAALEVEATETIATR